MTVTSLATGLALLLVACRTSTTGLSGAVEIDGSSTVFPITEAVAEEFLKLHPGVRINAGISGTGGGFKRFLVGETEINDASRPITEREKQIAAQNGVEWIELPVAYDGLAVVVHPQNSWVDHLSLAELKLLWEPGSPISRWNQLRPSWPNQPLHLYGPGTDSGTFDYFTETVVGETGASRPDYTASEDDNVLVQGISGDKNSLGYFGFAYYAENRGRVKLVAIAGGKGPVLPSPQTVNDHSYPLSRPLFIYVNRAALQRPEVREFVRFYLTQAPTLVALVGYVPLPGDLYDQGLSRIEK